MSSRSISRNSRPRCLAWIGQSSGRSLSLCHADTVSHCSASASTPPCSAQQFSYLAPERIVGFLRLCRCQHLAENPDQGFLDSTVLIMQSLQLLLGQGLSFPDAPQHHLDQFIAAAHACLTQESEQQRVPLSRLGDVADIAHVERRGFGGELAEFCVGDAFQQRIGINQASQPIEPFDPEPDGCRGRGAGRQLQAVELSRRAVCRPDQQDVQHRRVFGRDACGDPVVDTARELPLAAD